MKTGLINRLSLHIVSKGNVGNYRESFAMLLQGEHRLAFILNRDGTGSGRAMVSGSVVPLKKWTHVAVSCDGDTMHVYMNGKETGSGAYRGGIFSDQHPLLIGKSDRKGTSYQTSFFEGTIDEVRVYQRALSEAEILDLATQAK